MKKKFSMGVATLAAAAGLALAIPATASASPLDPHPAFSAGSMTFCFKFPVGPITISVC